MGMVVAFGLFYLLMFPDAMAAVYRNLGAIVLSRNLATSQEGSEEVWYLNLEQTEPDKDSGSGQTADRFLNAAVQWNGHDTRAHTLQGVYWLARHDWDRAQASLETASQTSKSSNWPMFWLGVLADARGDVEVAANTWVDAGALDFLMIRGLDYTHNGHPDWALRMYDALRPRINELVGGESKKLAEYYANVGRAFRWQGQYTEAARAYEEALRLDPEHTNYHVDLGASYLQAGRPWEALAEFQKAVERAPNWPDYLLWLGGAYRQLGLLEETERQWLAATVAGPAATRAHVWECLADLYEKAERWQEAIQAWENCVNLDPQNQQCRERLEAIRQRDSNR